MTMATAAPASSADGAGGAGAGGGRAQGATSTPKGKAPTTASLHRLLDAVLLDESDVNGFCLDNFAETRAAFAEKDNKEERIQKLLARDGRRAAGRRVIFDRLHYRHRDEVDEQTPSLEWEWILLPRSPAKTGAIFGCAALLVPLAGFGAISLSPPPLVIVVDEGFYSRMSMRGSSVPKTCNVGPVGTEVCGEARFCMTVEGVGTFPLPQSGARFDSRPALLRKVSAWLGEKPVLPAGAKTDAEPARCEGRPAKGAAVTVARRVGGVSPPVYNACPPVACSVHGGVRECVLSAGFCP